jgi:hypothetical protein
VSQSLAPIGLVHAIAKKKERKKKLFKEDVVYEFN